MESDQLHVPAFVFFQKWEEAQPKNLQVVPSAALSKNIDNLFHGCHICISPKSPKDHVFLFIFSPRHIADVLVSISKPIAETFIWNFNMLIKLCGFWFILRLTTSDILHRFRGVPHVTLFVSKDLDWFAFSGFSSCRII